MRAIDLDMYLKWEEDPEIWDELCRCDPDFVSGLSLRGELPHLIRMCGLLSEGTIPTDIRSLPVKEGVYINAKSLPELVAYVGHIGTYKRASVVTTGASHLEYCLDSYFRNVETLSLSHIWLLAATVLDRTLGSCCVTHLTLRHWEVQLSDDYQTQAPFLGHLKHLNLIRCEVSDKVWKDLSTGLSGLKTITFTRMRDIPYSALVLFPSLETVVLEDSDAPTEEELEMMECLMIKVVTL